MLKKHKKLRETHKKKKPQRTLYYTECRAGHKSKALHLLEIKGVSFFQHLIKSKTDGLNTSMNYFTGQQSLVDFEILDDIEQLPIMHHFDNLTTMEELNTAREHKLKKSPGPDGLLPEIFVHGVNYLNPIKPGGTESAPLTIFCL